MGVKLIQFRLPLCHHHYVYWKWCKNITEERKEKKKKNWSVEHCIWLMHIGQELKDYIEYAKVQITSRK